jgi:hypothetical protein
MINLDMDIFRKYLELESVISKFNDDLKMKNKLRGKNEKEN